MPGKFILHGRLQQPEGSEAIVSGWWTQGKHPIVHHQNPEKNLWPGLKVTSGSISGFHEVRGSRQRKIQTYFTF